MYSVGQLGKKKTKKYKIDSFFLKKGGQTLLLLKICKNRKKFNISQKCILIFYNIT